MARTPTFYIDRALAALEAGFTCEAARKRAIQDVGYAFEGLRRDIMDAYLSLIMEERTEEMQNFYWDQPMYVHLWKARHSATAIKLWPLLTPTIAQIESLVDLRKTIKDAPIVVVERQEDARVAVITNTVADMMKARMESYAYGLKLHDIFNGLPVSANVHMVTNNFGTTFPRTFYYMAGRLTALNVILAVLDAKKREAKG